MNKLGKKQRKSKYIQEWLKSNKYSEQNGKLKSVDVRKKKPNEKKLKKDDFG